MPPVIDSEHPAVRVWADLDARVVETQCGGVPVFWAEMPAPLRAQLAFRVGRADEPFSRAGISHLVEHLALSTLGERLYVYNGSVGADMTTFSVAGTETEIVEFFALLCQALRRLPLDRLDTERTVLLTEAARRNRDPVAALLWTRFGATGLGLLGIDEHGLRTADGDAVQAWADERFTAGNAALILTGPPPPGLALDLPPGRRFADAVSEPVAQPLPTAFNNPSEVVGLGAIVSRHHRGRPAFVRHLERALTQRLRMEQGITYSVAVGSLRVDADRDHVTVLADALAEQAGAVSSAMFAELNRMAREGVEPADMARDVEQVRRAGELPDTVGAALFRRLAAHLHGRPYEPLAASAAELLSLQPSDLAALATETRDTAMWLLPPGITLHDAVLRPFVQWSPVPVRADRYFTLRSPSGNDQRSGLALGEQGVTMVLRGSRFITVRWDQCVGAQSWSSGQWTLFGKDGFQLLLDPVEWEHPDEIRALVEAHVPEHVRIPMGEKQRPASAPAPPRRRRALLRLWQISLIVVPLFAGIVGFAGLFSGMAPRSSSPTVVEPVPQISLDPATNDITLIPGPPVPVVQQGSGDVSPAFLLMAVLGTSAAVGAARAAQRPGRR